MVEKSGFSRRNFLKGVGAGALAAGALPALGEGAAKPGPARPDGRGLYPAAPIEVTLNVNGVARKLEVEARVTLLDALRNRLDVTGAKKVCDRASCGACTVLVDGAAVYACSMLAVEAQGKRIETVESLASGARGEELAPIQAAFVAADAQQCGFCTSGFVVACHALLEKSAPQGALDRAAIHDGLAGNLCRCGTYDGITRAVMACTKGAKR